MAERVYMREGQSTGTAWLDLPGGQRVDMNGVSMVLAETGNPERMLLYTSDGQTVALRGAGCATVRAFMESRMQRRDER